MEYRKIKDVDLDISVIGFGCWQMGITWWTGTKDNETIPAVHKAIDSGVSLFDTADVYGFGHSEEVLAKAIADNRDKIIIATKVGLQWDDRGRISHNLKRDYVFKAVEDSLNRLKTDYIDIYQAHWPDPDTPIEETMDALVSLKNEGKVRYIGLSNFNIDQLKEAQQYSKIHFLQPPYSILQRDYEEDTLPFCKENDIGVLTYASIGKGLLAGKFNKNTRFSKKDFRSIDQLFSKENFEKNLKIVEKLKKTAEKLNIPLLHLAIAWNLSNPAVTSALVGIKRQEQLEGILGASAVILKKEILSEISNISCSSN